MPDSDRPPIDGWTFPDIHVATEGDTEDRFVLKIGDSVTEEDRQRVLDAGVEIIHDLEQVGYLVVRGDEAAVEETGYDHFSDMPVERGGNEASNDG